MKIKKYNTPDGKKYRMQEGNWFLCGWMVIVIAILFTPMCFYQAYQLNLLKKEPTQLIYANVVKNSLYTTMSGIHYTIDYEFTLSSRQGMTYKGGASLSKTDRDAIKKTGTILVRYLTSDPSYNIAEFIFKEDKNDIWKWPLFGLGVLTFGILYGVWFLKKSKACAKAAQLAEQQGLADKAKWRHSTRTNKGIF